MIPDNPSGTEPAAPDELILLYRDEHYIAVHKPSGLLVHRSPIDRHERRFALQEARNLVGQHVFPVHRLDKPTSGVLLFALSPEAANSLMLAFTAGRIAKQYIAIVRGYPPQYERIDYPLVERPDRLAEPLTDPDRDAQAAVTECTGLGQIEIDEPVGRYATARFGLMELRPQNGRRHQIRRHLHHIFHPIIGDTTHGDGRQNKFFRSHFNSHRLLLCATRVQFEHPYDNTPVTIEAPPSSSFTRISDALGWHTTLATALARSG
jgi:tRNA pseudouridine65 synthase